MTAPALARARVYRTPADPDDPDLGPCWHWRCEQCREQGNGCHHPRLHTPGSWRAAFCGGLRHIHVIHPRQIGEPGDAQHTTMFGHSRCSLVLPTQLQMVLATDILNGRSHQSSDPTAREFAREILAVGREAPL